MFIKNKLLLLLFCLTLHSGTTPCGAQEVSGPRSGILGQQPAAIKQQDQVEEIVRVKTRVVFIDALVRDKKTGAPVMGLPVESFQVLDDGKPRSLSYFNRQGLGRRPLAIVLVLDLSTSGILYLEKSEVMEHLIVALSQLKPEDEIAVMQRWYEPQEAPLSFQLRSRMVEDFTRDRPKTLAALRGVQQFAKQNLPEVKMFFSFKDAIKGSWKAGITGVAGIPAGPPISTTAAYDFESAVDKAPRLASEHPDSQLVILEITDDFGAEGFGKTRKTAHQLTGSGVIVSGMVVRRNLMDKAVNLTGRIVSPLSGKRFHTISYYGKQTGGEVVTVGRPKEFADAIDRIISGLTARYSLGFTLDESERNDDRVHKLEVKVKPRGTNRKLAVSARRSYIPKADR